MNFSNDTIAMPNLRFHPRQASAFFARPVVLLILLLLLILTCWQPRATHAAEIGAGAPVAPLAAREIPGQEKSLTRGAPVPAWVETPVLASEPSTQSPLVVRLSDVQVYVDKDPVVYIHRMLQANNASMLSSVGRIEISFQPEYQQAALHSLRVMRGASVIDKTKVAEIRFLQREQELDEGVYTGAVTAAIVIDDIRVGDIVDIAYSITGHNPVFGGKFFQSFSWDSGVPILQRHLTLNAPQERPIYYRVIGPGGAVQAREQKSGTRKITRFVADNVAPLDFEPYVPADIDQFRQIQFSEFRNWQEVAQWAAALFKVDSPSPGVKEAIAGMKGAADSDKTVQQALEYVQNNIRYLSVSLGENSHRPFPPDLVLARRYGDCKDKTLLLVTMLRQLGIEAAPVLVSTFLHKGLERFLPTPLVFDHAIVRAVANGKVYFLDPTRSAQYGPLANMGQAHGDAEVLVIQGDTDTLTYIPANNPEGVPGNARIERVVIGKIDGPAEMTVLYRYAGLSAEMARYGMARQSQEQLRKFFIASVLRRYPSAEMTAGPNVNDQRQSNILEIDMHYRIPAFLEKNSGGWQVRYQASNLKDRLNLPDSPRRNYPLALPTEPALSRYEFELTLPDDFNATYKPSERKLGNKAFNAKETLSFTGHIMRAALDLNLLADRVAPGEVADFMADARKLGGMIDGSVQISKSDLKSGNLRLLLDTPLKQRLLEQEEESIASKTRIIADARGAGAAIADTLCERALAYARLGKKADALADLQASLKQRPAANESLRCRAESAFINGDMKSSEADFSQAIALGAHEGKVYFERAMASYALGKWRDAADGYGLAFARFTDPQDKARTEIMRSLSLHHLNPRARVDSPIAEQDDWPGIVLAAADGSRNDDDVLRQIHRLTGDALETALADAYYYLAQLNLLAGNKMKASVYLQRSLDKGILPSAFRPVARLEVERLRR
ncbi:transglutaminase-like putative cysteine protease/lipoprotein NlpI [Oxalobacteraceae bacterium GrIS 1.11]